MLSDSRGLLHAILLDGQSISGPDIPHRQDAFVIPSVAAMSCMQCTSCRLLRHAMP